MKQLSINEDSINYKLERQIKIRDILVDLPVKYKGRAITALFPMPTKKAIAAINYPEISPAEISLGKSLLSITLFDYYWSPIGPYTELAVSIPVCYKSKINIPLIPLIINKFLKNFGFFVLDIAQSTEIAIEHGNKITGYPHNPKLIDVRFNDNGNDLYIEASGDKQKILNIQIKKPKKEKLIQQSYMTYFTKERNLFKIQMDIYGIEAKIKECKLNLGNHESLEFIRKFDVSCNSVETRYFRDVIEILNSPILLKNL